MVLVFDLDAMYVNWLTFSKNVIFKNQKTVLVMYGITERKNPDYCNIKRLMFSSGWRYYAEIVVKWRCTDKSFN